MDSFLNQGDLTSKEGATFGEYQVTTKKDGAESQNITSLDIIGTSNESQEEFQITATTDFNSLYAGQSQSDEVTFGEYQATGNSQSDNDNLQTNNTSMETLPAKFLPPITQGENDIQSALVSSTEINNAEANTPITEGLVQDASAQEATFGEYQTTTTTTTTTDFNISSNSNIKFSSVLPTKVLPTIIEGENEAQFKQSTEINQFRTEINQEFQAEDSSVGGLENIKLNIDTNTIQETNEKAEFATTNHIEGVELQNSQGDAFSFSSSKEQLYNENTDNIVSGGYETNTGFEETQFNPETTTDVATTNNELSALEFNSEVNAYTGEESGQSNLLETNIDTTGGFGQFGATTSTDSGLESTQFATETKVDTGAVFNQYNIEDTLTGMDANQYTNETTVDSNLQFGQLEEATTTNDTALNDIPFQVTADIANVGATIGQFEETSITNDTVTYDNQIQTEGQIITGFDASTFPSDGASNQLEITNETGTVDIGSSFGQFEATTTNETGFDATQFTGEENIDTGKSFGQFEVNTTNETEFAATQFTGEATVDTGTSFGKIEATTTNESGFDATQFTTVANVDAGSSFGQLEATTTNETGFDAAQFTTDVNVDADSTFEQIEATTTNETGFDITQFTTDANVDTGSTFEKIEATTTNETGFDATQFTGDAAIDTIETRFDATQITTDANIGTGAAFGQFEVATTNETGFGASQFAGEATVDAGSSFEQFEATTTNETGFDATQFTTDANVDTGATFGQFEATTANVDGSDAIQFKGETTIDTFSSFRQFEGNTTNETGFDATQFTTNVNVDTGSAFGQIETTTTNETGFDATQFTNDVNADTGLASGQIEATTTNETGFDATQFTGEATVDNGLSFGQFEAISGKETTFDATQFSGEPTTDASSPFGILEATTTNETGFDETQFTGVPTTSSTFEQIEATTTNETGFDATQFTGEATVDTGSSFGQFEGTVNVNDTGFDASQFKTETSIDTGASFGQYEAGATKMEAGFEATQFTSETKPSFEAEVTVNETGYDASQLNVEAADNTAVELGQFGDNSLNINTELTSENTFQQAETTIDNNFNLKELDINALQANPMEVSPSFNTNEFQANTVEEANSSLDINVLQATASEESIPSFDVDALKTTATEEAVIPYDINALQSEVNYSTHTFDATKYVNTSSLINTTSTLQETPSNEVNGFQSIYPLIDETSALPTFSGNEGHIGLDSNTNEYPAQSNTNENTFQEVSTAIESKSNLTPKVVEEAGATFGEYQITTKNNDFQSQYTYQINTSPETTLQSTNNFIKSEIFQESLVPSVPKMSGLKLPTSTINTTTKFTSSKGNDSSSFAKVTPLKGSFAVSRKNKIVGNVGAIPLISKTNFNSFTYKPNLRANFVNNGAETKSNSFSQIREIYSQSEYKATTYNPKSHY